jgi:hypothetical protein
MIMLQADRLLSTKGILTRAIRAPGGCDLEVIWPCAG